MKTPSILKTVLAIAVAFALFCGAAAMADETSVSGRTGDGAASHPHIVKAIAGHAGGGKLKHTIRTEHAFADAASPCLAIREVYPNTDSLYMCANGKIKKASNGSVLAHARVSHPDGHTVVYTFTRSAIGNSTAYRWQAQSRAKGCHNHLCDVAPAHFALNQEVDTYGQWAGRFLDQVNAPDCKSNRIAVLAWQANEGTSAVFNPLATTWFLKGSTKFNSSGVRNYVSLAQGVKAVRLTLVKGSKSYGYGPIIDRLDACAPALRTAKAIRASSWCSGCASGHYVTGLIDDVRGGFKAFASKQISTYPKKRVPERAAAGVVASRDAGVVPA